MNNKSSCDTVCGPVVGDTAALALVARCFFGFVAVGESGEVNELDSGASVVIGAIDGDGARTGTELLFDITGMG